MKKVVIGIIVAIIVVAVIIMGVVVYRRNHMFYESIGGIEEGNTVVEKKIEGSLIAIVQTREEAEEIALLYEITLAGYENNIAFYVTDRDPQELIMMGKEKGYPTISINNSYTIK